MLSVIRYPYSKDSSAAKRDIMLTIAETEMCQVIVVETSAQRDLVKEARTDIQRRLLETIYSLA